MKKKILTMLLLAAGSIASLYAQQKGDMFVGTMLGFSIQKTTSKIEYKGNSEKTENDPVVTLDIEPGFHYFIADKFRLGLQMGFTRASQKSNDEDGEYEESIGAINIGPVAAYYVQLADRFYLTPELGFYYVHSKYKEELNNKSNEEKYNGFALNAKPLQFEFRATNRVAIAAGLFSINLVHQKAADTGDWKYSSNTFSMNLGINPTVGIHLYL